MESGTAGRGSVTRGERHDGNDPYEADANEADLGLATGHSPAFGNESQIAPPIPSSQAHGGATSLNEDLTPRVKKVLQARTTPSTW